MPFRIPEGYLLGIYLNGELVFKMSQNKKRSLSLLISKLGSRINLILQENFGSNLISLCLFGSASRGSLREGSDIDFLVVLDKAPASYHSRAKQIVPLVDKILDTSEYAILEERNLDLEPSFLLLTTFEVEAHPPILIDLSHEGEILYDKDDFLKRHLTEVRITLDKLGAVKKQAPGGYYWVLKPDLKKGEVIEI